MCTHTLSITQVWGVKQNQSEGVDDSGSGSSVTWLAKGSAGPAHVAPLSPGSSAVFLPLRGPGNLSEVVPVAKCTFQISRLQAIFPNQLLS